jgi:hypothetical protein
MVITKLVSLSRCIVANKSQLHVRESTWFFGMQTKRYNFFIHVLGNYELRPHLHLSIYILTILTIHILLGSGISFTLLAAIALSPYGLIYLTVKLLPLCSQYMFLTTASFIHRLAKSLASIKPFPQSSRNHILHLREQRSILRHSLSVLEIWFTSVIKIRL